MNESPFAGKVVLAPLTRGGHAAFRRLVVELGAEVTTSEMAVVKNLLSNSPAEFALLRSHPSEPFFGVQLADRKPETAAEGARLAASRGARFVDLNCGCPIDAITRKGLGASLLRKPTLLARVVTEMVKAVDVPVTVKLRLGWSEAKGENVSEVAKVCEEAGAAAIGVHGRFREQRYQKAANWDAIARVAAERSVPVIGNGDVLTWYEAHERWQRTGVSALMLGRGALIKPWLFREIRERREIFPDPEERLYMTWRLLGFMREYFGDKPSAHRRIGELLPWHLGFFCRYRPLPEAEWGEASRRHPLLQTRLPLGDDLAPLERLLRDGREATHRAIAERLITAASFDEALERARALALELPPDAGGEASEASAALVAG
jgi:tRNA-dihydrouridine synthase 3